MKRILSSLLICILMACALCACTKKPDSYDSQGNPVYFSKLHGKWVFINYWASWCHPCWQEIPELNAFAKDYANKVVIFGVNFDQVNADQLKDLAKKMNIQYPNLTSDPGAQFGVTDIPALPMTIVINPQGKVTTILTGEQTEKSLQESIGVV